MSTKSLTIIKGRKIVQKGYKMNHRKVLKENHLKMDNSSGLIEMGKYLIFIRIFVNFFIFTVDVLFVDYRTMVTSTAVATIVSVFG